MMIPSGLNGASMAMQRPINPQLLLLHQLLNGGRTINPGIPGGSPGPVGSVGGNNGGEDIHGFGPGGTVTGHRFPPVRGHNPLAFYNQDPRYHGNLNALGGGNSGHADIAAALAQLTAGGGGNGGFNPSGINPGAEALHDPNLWIQRHPAAMGAGHVPQWVTDELGNSTGTLGNEPAPTPNVPADVANGFRAPGGGDPRDNIGNFMRAHQDNIAGSYERAHQLAQRIARKRVRRGARQSLRNFRPPTRTMQPPPNTYS